MTTVASLDPLHLPLTGIQLIEASAGTGKTWTIAALYLRLVLGHGGGEPLLPAQILVMTFTKAATAELRERIRNRLAEAADAFRGQREADDFLRALIAEYPDAAARAVAACQLERAARWMDEAAVFTIHGWCQRMLTQHAFASGEAMGEAELGDEAALLEEAARDYWRRFCFPLAPDSAVLLLQHWSSPEKMLGDVRPLLAHPAAHLLLAGKPLPPLDDPAHLLGDPATKLREASDQAQTCWRTDGAAIAALLQQAVKNGDLSKASYKPDTLAADREAFDAWAAGAELPGDKTLERHTSTKLRGATNKKGNTPEHPFFDAIEKLRAARDAVEPVHPLLLAHAVAWIGKRLDEVRRERALLGYDDMLRRLDDALHGANDEALARAIAAQYPVALVDEFQDTDPLQWHSLERIHTTGNSTALLLIGDPKQAIYAFRGADIHTYLQARTRAAQPHWTLCTNYRSTSALVDAVNRVFDFAGQHQHGAFGFEHHLPFRPVKANGRKQTLQCNGAEVAALQLAVRTSEVPMTADLWRSDMASHAAAQIVTWLSAAGKGRCGFVDAEGLLTPLRQDDIAILVRTGREAATMRTALRARGLSSVYLSDRDSVYASAEAADLLRWLQACARPDDDHALRAALATPSMARGLHELDRLDADAAWRETCDAHLHELHRLWQRHGVLAMLHELLHRFDLPARLLAREDGERALTNLLHLAELLQQAATGMDGEQALIRFLAAQIDHPAGDETADEQIVRLESEAALIKVVTIHKSKGMEYPVVLLPFACGFREVQSDDAFIWHDAQGNTLRDLSPDAAAVEQADCERLQEDLRLLYVALTRARHACWLGVACTKDGRKKDSGLHKSAFGYVLGGGTSIEPSQVKTRVDALAEDEPAIHVATLAEEADNQRLAVAATAPAPRAARTCTLPPREPWWIASYSALAHSSDTPHAAPETASQANLIETATSTADEDAAAPLQGIHAFPRGAAAGSFLHELLEGCANEGFAYAAAPSDRLRELVARRCQTHGWAAWNQPLLHWLGELLRTPLALPGGDTMPLTALADPLSCRAELEFWFEANRVDAQALDRLVTAHTLDGAPRTALAPHKVNGMLKGFIDLVFEHGGRWYVIDYKSNWLGREATAYTAPAMCDSVLQARYDLQYAIYTLALHRQLKARLPGYDYARHIGGVLYLYLRGVDGAGHGVHAERLPFELVDAMDQMFAAGSRRHVD